MRHPPFKGVIGIDTDIWGLYRGIWDPKNRVPLKGGDHTGVYRTQIIGPL